MTQRQKLALHLMATHPHWTLVELAVALGIRHYQSAQRLLARAQRARAALEAAAREYLDS